MKIQKSVTESPIKSCRMTHVILLQICITKLLQWKNEMRLEFLLLSVVQCLS